MSSSQACAVIVDHARAEAISGARETPDIGYGQWVADHDIARQRALQFARGRRLFPSLHAATVACSRLTFPVQSYRTGIVVATSVTDRHVAGQFPDAFGRSSPDAPQHSRRLDVMVAVSRFVSGGLLQDIASMLGIDGPELCLPGDCGIAPLALARLFIDAGRAEAMIVVAVEPQPGGADRHEAIAVVAARTTADRRTPALPSPSDTATDGNSCIAAISEYLSRSHASHQAQMTPCEIQGAVRWGMLATASDPHGWLDRSRELLDQCARVASTKDLGVVCASFLDLAPDHALRAIERGDPPNEVARAAGQTTFGGELRRHAASRGLHGPFFNVVGIPGASLLALAIAEDLIKRGVVPAVAVIAGDWVGEGAARALGVLKCPDRPHLQTSASAVLLQRVSDCMDAPRVRSFVARRHLCDRFNAEFRANAPSHTEASGCTSQDVEAAARFIAEHRPPTSAGLPSTTARHARFLGGDALACLVDMLHRGEPAAVSVRNELGGSGMVLLDATESHRVPFRS